MEPHCGMYPLHLTIETRLAVLSFGKSLASDESAFCRLDFGAMQALSILAHKAPEAPGEEQK
jgi:hypothetical protein